METFWFFRLRFCLAHDSTYDFDFRFSLGRKRSYDSVSDSDYYTVASENQFLLGDRAEAYPTQKHKLTLKQTKTHKQTLKANLRDVSIDHIVNKVGAAKGFCESLRFFSEAWVMRPIPKVKLDARKGNFADKWKWK